MKKTASSEFAKKMRALGHNDRGETHKKFTAYFCKNFNKAFYVYLINSMHLIRQFYSDYNSMFPKSSQASKSNLKTNDFPELGNVD